MYTLDNGSAQKPAVADARKAVAQQNGCSKSAVQITRIDPAKNGGRKIPGRWIVFYKLRQQH